MLLRPLFFTSWLIDDFLRDSDMFGAGTVSSRARPARRRAGSRSCSRATAAAEVVGLSSARGAEYARSIGVYDAVLTYEELEDLPAGRAVYVDMSGAAAVREGVHRRYGAELAHSAVVGATHHDQMGAVAGGPPRAEADLLLRPRPGRQALGRVGARAARTEARRGLGAVCEVDRRLARGDPRAGPRAAARDLPGPARRAHRPGERARARRFRASPVSRRHRPASFRRFEIAPPSGSPICQQSGGGASQETADADALRRPPWPHDDPRGRVRVSPSPGPSRRSPPPPSRKANRRRSGTPAPRRTGCASAPPSASKNGCRASMASPSTST